MLFIAQILSIVGSLLVWIPFIGNLPVIVAAALEIAGIYKAGGDDKNYRGALVFAFAVLVVSVISGALGESVISGVLEAGNEVLSLLLVYSVCGTTSSLLRSIGQDAISGRGNTVIKIYAGCTVVFLVCRVLSVVPIINLAAGVMSAAASIVEVVGYVMFLLFLYDSSKVL